MPVIAFHHLVWQELHTVESGLRGACKANLDRLAATQWGVPSGLRLEKVHAKITELKVSWNKQDFRLLFFHGANKVIFIVVFFQKKTRKTPKHQINLAVSRMQEILLEQATTVSHSLH
jgi:phage-related protein